MFEDIPTYVVVLGVVELVIVPLLWRAGSKISTVVDHIETCVESLQQTYELLAKIVDEQGATQVRDKDVEGRLKGIDGRLDRIEQNLSNKM